MENSQPSQSFTQTPATLRAETEAPKEEKMDDSAAVPGRPVAKQVEQTQKEEKLQEEQTQKEYLESKLQERNHKDLENVKMLTQEVNTLQAESMNSESRDRGHRVEIKELQNIVESLKKQLQDDQKEKEELKRRLQERNHEHVEQIERLTQKVDALQAECSSSERRESGHKWEMQKLQDCVESLKKLLQEEQTQKEYLESKLQERNQKDLENVKMLTQEVNTLQAESMNSESRDRGHRVEIKELQNIVESLKKQLQDDQKEKEELKSKLQKTHHENLENVKRLEQELKVLEEESSIRELREEGHNMEMQELQDRVQSLEKQLQAEQLRADEIQKEQRELKSTLQEKDRQDLEQVKRLEQKLRVLYEERSNRESREMRHNTEKQELRGIVASQNNMLQSEVLRGKNLQAQLDEERHLHHEVFYKACNQIESLNRKVAHLQQELKEQQEETRSKETDFKNQLQEKTRSCMEMASKLKDQEEYMEQVSAFLCKKKEEPPRTDNIQVNTPNMVQETSEPIQTSPEGAEGTSTFQTLSPLRIIMENSQPSQSFTQTPATLRAETEAPKEEKMDNSAAVPGRPVAKQVEALEKECFTRVQRERDHIKENQELRDHVDSLKNQLEAKNQEVNALQEECLSRELGESINNKEKQELKILVASKNNELQAEQLRADELQKEKEELKRKLQERDSQDLEPVERLEQELRVLYEERSNRESSEMGHNKEKQELRELVASQNKNVQAEQERADELQKQQEDLKRRFQETDSKNLEQIKRLKQEVKVLKEERSSRESSESCHRVEMKELQHRVEYLKKKLQDEQKEKEELKSKLQERDHQDLEQFERLKQKVNTLQEKWSSSVLRESGHKWEMQKLQDRVESLEKLLQEEQTQKEYLESKLQERNQKDLENVKMLTQEVNTLQAERINSELRDRGHRVEIKELQNIVESLKKQQQDDQKEKEELKRRLQERNHEHVEQIERLTQEVNTLQEKLSSSVLRESGHKWEMQKLQDRVESLKKQLQDDQKEKEELKSKLQERDHQDLELFERLKQTVNTLQEKWSSSVLRESGHKWEMQKLQDRVESLKKQLQDDQKEKEELKSKLQERNHKDLENVKMLTQEVNTLQAESMNSESRDRGHRVEIKELQNIVESLKKQLQDDQKEKEEWKSKLQKTHHENLENVKRLEQELKVLEEESSIRELREEGHNMEMQELQDRVQSLEKQLQAEQLRADENQKEQRELKSTLQEKDRQDLEQVKRLEQELRVLYEERSNRESREMRHNTEKQELRGIVASQNNMLQSEVLRGKNLQAQLDEERHLHHEVFYKACNQIESRNRKVAHLQQELKEQQEETRSKETDFKNQLQEKTRSCMEMASKLKDQEEYMEQVSAFLCKKKEEPPRTDNIQVNTPNMVQETSEPIQTSPEGAEGTPKMEKASWWTRLKKGVTLHRRHK
ncbi:trichohyalin-like [Notolabrus celidotus]|uniref:trichohyalin-like n=1 Tax=Notolabrus celidotus TaxID=1203425 RepID=UPI00148FF841|nr:trichohyalin-like [Notolabrus celidotus]